MSKMLRLPLIAMQSLFLGPMAPARPVPAGPNTGSVSAPGQPAFRLGVVGESTAASLGVPSHEKGISGVLARALAAGTQRRVDWVAFGSRRATIRRIREELVPQLPADCDLVVLLTGLNDVRSHVSVENWRYDVAATIEDLIVRNRRVLVSGIPPLSTFPALPHPLADYLDERACAMDAVTREVCAARDGVTFAPNRDTFEAHPECLFAEGEHHSHERCYELWARSLAKRVLARA